MNHTEEMAKVFFFSGHEVNRKKKQNQTLWRFTWNGGTCAGKPGRPVGGRVLDLLLLLYRDQGILYSDSAHCYLLLGRLRRWWHSTSISPTVLHRRCRAACPPPPVRQKNKRKNSFFPAFIPVLLYVNSFKWMPLKEISIERKRWKHARVCRSWRATLALSMVIEERKDIQWIDWIKRKRQLGVKLYREVETNGSTSHSWIYRV